MSDGYVLFSMVDRLARKAHRCIWCGQAIEAGSTYKDERSVGDGRIQRHRWHPECLADQGRLCREWGEDEFTPWENERPAPLPACVRCGKTVDHPSHVRFGNDVDNPVKHDFVPREADSP